MGELTGYDGLEAPEDCGIVTTIVLDVVITEVPEVVVITIMLVVTDI